MNRLFRHFLIPLLSLYSAGCAPVTVNQLIAEGKTPLSSQELRNQIPGMNLHLEAIDFDAQVQFQPDGHLTAIDLQNQKEQGQWTITEENRLCLKFSRWYFGDQNCYQLVKDKNDYIFFTTNGARYYTATLISGGSNVAAQPTGDFNQDKKRRNIDQASEDTPVSAVPLSQEEKKETLVRVARNCPACNLTGVTLNGAHLVAANLAGADLSKADLSDANLRRANLAGANLSNARLVHTNLSGADLSGCNLSHSDLTGANLIRANVTKANLDGAILDGAYLESIQGMTK